MGIKQVPTEVFINYLKYLGLIFIRKDQWNHDLYDYPDGHPNGKLQRCPAVRSNYKDIPITHIHTNLECVKKSKADFEKWLKLPKKLKKSK
jgi:hypothetical protein